MKILFFSNSTDNILNYRLNLINFLKKKGHQIEILLPDAEDVKKLFFLRLKIYTIKFNPRSLNFFLDVFLLFRIYKIFNLSRPDLILQYTIKPVVYGSLVSRVLKLKVINTITGLGSTFFNEYLSKLIFFLYYFSQKKVKKIIFQNSSDKNIFLINNIIKKNQCAIVNGSGFDPVKFKLISLPKKNVTTFALVSRILKEKGILEYIRAAEELTNIYKKKVKFLLVGKLKKDNFFVDKNIIINANNKKIIKYYKETKNVQKIIKKIHCLVLPSYREGFSKILMEASSMGRPLIASKVPGCKEIIKNNITGYLCDSKDYLSLMRCMKKIINSDISRLSKMGVKGSKYVMGNYSDKIINKKIYKLIKNN
jgi:glycosyltransferase involved in cell wall biosynthesis